MAGAFAGRGPYWRDLTTGRWYDADNRRVGNQRPRIFVGPKGHAAMTSAVEDVRTIAATMKRPLYEWQDWFLTEALRERDDGLWGAMTVVNVVPRQNGKTLGVILRILTGVFVWGERTIVYSAHQFTTTLETFGALVGVLEQSKRDNVDYDPEVQRLVEAVGGYRVINTNGHEAVVFGNGSRVKFVARTKGKGRGFTGDCVIFDEAGFKIDQSVTDALVPALSAVYNPQLWYLSSSGDLDSNVLLALRKKAISGADSMCYAEWSIPQRFDDPDEEDPDTSDMALAYEANPLLGIRISTRYLQEVELSNLTREGYLRERLGVWAEPTDSDRPLDLVTWGAGADAGVRRQIAVAGIDVSIGRDSACLVSCWAEGPRLIVHVEEHGPLDLVEKAARLLAARHLETTGEALPVVVPAYGPAAPVAARLRGDDVEVVDMPGGKASAACAGFADLLRRGEIGHYEQEPLDAAVEAATKHVSGSTWTFDRRSVSDDVSPLWAAAAAVWFMDTLDAAGDDEIGDDDVGVG